MRYWLRLDDDLAAARAEVARLKLERFVRAAWIGVAWILLVLVGGAVVGALGFT